MSINDAQARIKARVWQAIAQTELDVSALDKETLETLVDLVSEAAMLDIDSEMETTIKHAIPDDIFDDEKEDILWEGRPFLSISLHYTITDERIRITEGFLGKSRANVELIRVQDIDYGQTFSERVLNLGDIIIRSHDTGNPQVVLKNIKDPESVYEILRKAVLRARKKHGFTYREEM